MKTKPKKRQARMNMMKWASRYAIAMTIMGSSYAYSQTGIAYQGMALTTVSINGTSVTKPISSAIIVACPAANTVCIPANAAQLYADVALTQPMSSAVVADKYGNFSFYIAPGQYKYTIYTPANVQIATYPFTAGVDGANFGNVLVNPQGGQVVTQATGTTLQINNLNQTAVINGDGTTDKTALVQAAVNACPADKTCNINLANVLIAGTVNIPLTSQFVFIGTGKTNCTAVNANCFSRTGGGNNVPSRYRVRFTGFDFVKANTGAVIADIQQFSSAGNSGMTIDNNSFTLSGSARGLIFEGCSFTNVDTNWFSSPRVIADPNAYYPDRTGVAIQPQSVTSAYGPIVGTVTNNHFNYLAKSFNPVITQAGWEGWTISTNHFSASPANFTSGNEINLLNNEFSSSPILFTGSNAIISGNYFDVGTTPAANIVTMWDAIHINVENNTFIANSAQSNGLVFQNAANPSAGSGTTNVNVTGNMFLGSGTTPGSGSAMIFADAGARNLYVADNNARLWYVMHEIRTLDRSTFGQFEARDVNKFGTGFDTNAGPYVRAPYLYQKVPVHAAGTLDNTLVGQGVFFADTWVPQPDMLPGVVTTMVTNSCDTGATASLVGSAQGAVVVRLLSGQTTTVGMHSCDVTITFDGQSSVPPR